MLRSFDKVVDMWMEQVWALGSAGTFITFIVAASQVLSEKTMLKELISKAARHGRRWTEQPSATIQGPVL